MIYIAALCLCLLYPSQLAMTLTKWSKDPIKMKKSVKGPGGKRIFKNVMRQPSLTIAEIMMCLLPYGSAIMSWKALYKKAGWTGLISALSIGLIIFRIVAVFTTLSTALWVVSFWLFWAGVLLFHLLYVITTCVVCHKYALSMWVFIVTLIFPYGAAYKLRVEVPRVMLEIRKEDDDTFKG